jgi:hypothetical protein
MDRLTRRLLPMAGLVAIATAVVAALPGHEPGLPRTQAGASQAAATEAGALAHLCAGWGNARRDCAAFAGHFITSLAQRRPEAGLCMPPPAALAEWTLRVLEGTAPDQPWAPVLEAALTTTRAAHPLPCAAPNPDAAPATEARPT